MKRVAVAIVVLLVGSVAGAAEYSDLYIIPVAGHAEGAFNTAWRSDVVIHNFQAVPIMVDIAVVESGRGSSAEPILVSSGADTAFLLMPGETRTLSDALAGIGRDVIGALVVGGDMPFALTSRIWAELPDGRTLGQSVVPVPIGGAADAVTAMAVLPALATSARQRSNVGLFIAASHAPLVVEVATTSITGAALGSQLIVVDEPGFVHRQLAVIDAGEEVTALVRILEGDGIAVPYASTIDNETAEAVFTSAPPLSLRGSMSLQMLRAAARAAVR